MKKSIILFLGAIAFCSCSTSVAASVPPTETLDVSKIAPAHNSNVITAAEFWQVGNVEFVEMNLTYVTSGHVFYTDKFVVLSNSELFLNREQFISHEAVTLTGRKHYVKEKIYLLNCAIRQC